MLRSIPFIMESPPASPTLGITTTTEIPKGLAGEEWRKFKEQEEAKEQEQMRSQYPACAHAHRRTVTCPPTHFLGASNVRSRRAAFRRGSRDGAPQASLDREQVDAHDASSHISRKHARMCARHACGAT